MPRLPRYGALGTSVVALLGCDPQGGLLGGAATESSAALETPAATAPAATSAETTGGATKGSPTVGVATGQAEASTGNAAPPVPELAPVAGAGGSPKASLTEPDAPKKVPPQAKTVVGETPPTAAPKPAPAPPKAAESAPPKTTQPAPQKSAAPAPAKPPAPTEDPPPPSRTFRERKGVSQKRLPGK